MDVRNLIVEAAGAADAAAAAADAAAAAEAQAAEGAVELWVAIPAILEESARVAAEAAAAEE